MARRASYIKTFAKRNPGLPIVQVDAGALLIQQSLADPATNKTMLASLKEISTDAANLSAEDLYFFEPPATAHAGPSPPPPFVSANVEWKRKSIAGLKPYYVKEITVTTSQGPKRLRVGFTGVTDPGKPLLETGFTIGDPVKALTPVLRDLRTRCDLVVLLADVSQEKAMELARGTEGIDVLIAAASHAFPPPPTQLNDTYIFGSVLQGRYLGELKVYLDGNGELSRYKARYITLDEGIPDDPKLATLVESTRKILAEHHRKTAAASLARAPRPVYAGSDRCVSCHTSAHDVWKRTRHAQAIETLKRKGQEFNPQCLRCHTTGFGIEGGFLDVLHTPTLSNVHCETCHGPGLAHTQNPSQRLFSKPKETCVSCHTSIDSPNFDFAKAWSMIKH
ncbi:MAG: hypothetical protein HYR55_07055 [Acidobacteria bacterium]|nr:hypothetical protein [Acidobacteriota bacterium]